MWNFNAMKRFYYFCLVGLCIHLVPLCSCSSGRVDVFREARLLMGTVVEIAVADRSEGKAREAIRVALDEMARIDDLLSSYKEQSVVSGLNRAGHGAGVPVGEEVLSILRRSLSISEASGGAFDVTIAPLMRVWKFDSAAEVPGRELLEDAIRKVGYQNLISDPSSATVRFAVAGMAIDLGGIAAGWAADKAMEKLKENGVLGAIVDAGGELRVMGSRPDGSPWRIGVQHPRKPGDMLVTFPLRDTAIATSGDYERFFVADGVRYHHILDPATGMPARGCQSVTVLAPTATEADACATAAFVLGPARGLDFLRSRPGVRGLIVDAEGRLHWSDPALERLAGR